MFDASVENNTCTILTGVEQVTSAAEEHPDVCHTLDVMLLADSLVSLLASATSPEKMLSGFCTPYTFEHAVDRKCMLKADTDTLTAHKQPSTTRAFT